MMGSPSIAPDADLFGRAVARRSPGSQLALPLVWCRSAHEGNGEFLVGESNALAARHLQQFAGWSSPATILIGPQGCGKSMLARLFVAAGAGEAIDGLIEAGEQALFHAWNRALTDNHHLLIVAQSYAQVDAVILPDLRTRLATAPVVTIADPDAPLCAALIERLLVSRGLSPPPALANYIADRIERSYGAVHQVVDAIDTLALASGRPLGIRLAREAMVAAGLFHATSDDGDEQEEYG